MTQHRFTLRQRLRYRFDNALARGTLPVLAWVVLLAAGVVLLAAIVMWLLGAGPQDADAPFPETVWIALTRSLDPGTFGTDQGTHFRLITLAVTVAGIFFLAAVIGLVTNAINRRLEELRRGGSLVVEAGHTLILGWSPKVPTIVSELLEAHSNHRGRHVVVLCRNDAADVEQQVRSHLIALQRSNPVSSEGRRALRRLTHRASGPVRGLVVRTGDPAHVADLERVNPTMARSVIVPTPDLPNPDASVVRTVIGLLRFDARGRPSDGRATIVAEVADEAVARSLRTSSPGRALVVSPRRIIARLTAQVVRFPGLSRVYQELLDFAGDEIYIWRQPGVSGRTFAETTVMVSDASVIGLRHEDGTVELNPDPATVLTDETRIVAIATDDDPEPRADRVDPRRLATAGARPAATKDRVHRRGERTLIIGWSDLGPFVVNELGLVDAEATIDVVVDPEFVTAATVRAQTQGLPVALEVHEAVTTTTAGVQQILKRHRYHHALLLCYRDDVQPDAAEAYTLLTLMHVRRELPEGTNLVTELLTVEDVDLAAVAAPDDFIVSERLTSLYLAQISEEPDLVPVFRALFRADGPDIAFRDAADLLDATVETLTYGEVVATAAPRRECVIGVRVDGALDTGSALPGGIVMNPHKDQTLRRESLRHVVVLAPSAGPPGR